MTLGISIIIASAIISLTAIVLLWRVKVFNAGWQQHIEGDVVCFEQVGEVLDKFENRLKVIEAKVKIKS